MARPNKMGLDYFPFDVDFFNDEKIVAISGEFGIKGEIVVIKLLCAIYRNGYFILWNDLLKFKLLRDLPGVSSELLDSIMNRLVLWGFFDKDLFDSMGVLTSAGIQKRYFKISKRRKSVDDFRYLLIKVSGCETRKFFLPTMEMYRAIQLMFAMAGLMYAITLLLPTLMYAKTPQRKGKEIIKKSLYREIKKIFPLPKF